MNLALLWHAWWKRIVQRPLNLVFCTFDPDAPRAPSADALQRVAVSRRAAAAMARQPALDASQPPVRPAPRSAWIPASRPGGFLGGGW